MWDIQNNQYEGFSLFCLRNGHSSYHPLNKDEVWSQLLHERYDGIRHIKQIREKLTRETGFTLDREANTRDMQQNNPLYSWYYKDKQTVQVPKQEQQVQEEPLQSQQWKAYQPTGASLKRRNKNKGLFSRVCKWLGL